MSDDGYDDLVGGVRDALREVGVRLDDPELLDQLRDALAEVTAPPPSQGEPHLRVVEPDESPPPSAPRRSVKVVRMAGSPEPHSLQQGRIAVAAEQWQTLVRASAERSYRVHAQSGQLDVAVDGELVERLGAGQSIDVEGRLVRVRGVVASSGCFLRL